MSIQIGYVACDSKSAKGATSGVNSYCLYIYYLRPLNPTQDGLLWDCSWMEGGRRKILVIPYLKMIQNTCESRDTLFKFCWHLHFFESLKIVLINMVLDIVIILMMLAKMATTDLLKKAFWNEGHEVIISVRNVTKKILLRDWNYCRCGHVTKLQ